MENNNDIQQDNVEQVNQQEQINYETKYSEAAKELEKLRKQNSDFFNELKKFKKDQNEKAQQNGDFEKLLKVEREEKEQIKKDYEGFKNQYRNEKINNQAIRLANELAPNAQSANLLSHFIKDNLGKMADENGDLSDDVIDSVKKEVKMNKDFAPLVAGSKASGGGAPGAGNGVAGNKELNMSDYDKLTPQQKLEFGRLVQAGKAKLI